MPGSTGEYKCIRFIGLILVGWFYAAYTYVGVKVFFDDAFRARNTDLWRFIICVTLFIGLSGVLMVLHLMCKLWYEQAPSRRIAKKQRRLDSDTLIAGDKY